MTGGAGMIAGRRDKENWKGFADSATFATGPLRIICESWILLGFDWMLESFLGHLSAVFLKPFFGPHHRV